jgi:hypothetical protein
VNAIGRNAVFAGPQQSQENAEQPQEDDRTVHAAQGEGQDCKRKFVIADEAQQQRDDKQDIEQFLALIENRRRADIPMLLEKFSCRPVGNGLRRDDGLLSCGQAVSYLSTFQTAIQSQLFDLHGRI